jgi:hypothetical protein
MGRKPKANVLFDAMASTAPASYDWRTAMADVSWKMTDGRWQMADGKLPREVPSLTLFVRSFMHLLVTSTVIEVNKLPDSSNRSASPNSPPLAPASQEPALVARIRPRKKIA